MTVKELIEELKKYDSGMLIFVVDSEWGSEEADSIEIRKNEVIWRDNKRHLQDVLVIK